MPFHDKTNNESDFDWDEYYKKGEKLYTDFASGADVFDPKHPGISMFDEEGQFTQAYTDASGWKSYGTGTMTPRRGYFTRKMMELSTTLRLIIPSSSISSLKWAIIRSSADINYISHSFLRSLLDVGPLLTHYLQIPGRQSH